MNEIGKQPSLRGLEDRLMDARRLSIELPEQLAEIVDALVASGGYADASEVIREALELFTAEDEPLEDWQERELIAAYDEWKANPTAVYTVEEVRAHLEERRQRD